jgi:hypothetical protein
MNLISVRSSSRWVAKLWRSACSVTPFLIPAASAASWNRRLSWRVVIGAGTAAAGLLTGGFAEKTLTEAGCIVVAKDLRDLTNSFGITAALHGTDAADRVRGANSARHVSRRSH